MLSMMGFKEGFMARYLVVLTAVLFSIGSEYALAVQDGSFENPYVLVAPADWAITDPTGAGANKQPVAAQFFLLPKGKYWFKYTNGWRMRYEKNSSSAIVCPANRISCWETAGEPVAPAQGSGSAPSTLSGNIAWIIWSSNILGIPLQSGVDFYEIQTDDSTSFSSPNNYMTEFPGSLGVIVNFQAYSAIEYGRARACNSFGCSPWILLTGVAICDSGVGF